MNPSLTHSHLGIEVVFFIEKLHKNLFVLNVRIILPNNLIKIFSEPI